MNISQNEVVKFRNLMAGYGVESTTDQMASSPELINKLISLKKDFDIIRPHVEQWREELEIGVNDLEGIVEKTHHDLGAQITVGMVKLYLGLLEIFEYEEV